jgi:hypothetical protein
VSQRKDHKKDKEHVVVSRMRQLSQRKFTVISLLCSTAFTSPPAFRGCSGSLRGATSSSAPWISRCRARLLPLSEAQCTLVFQLRTLLPNAKFPPLPKKNLTRSFNKGTLGTVCARLRVVLS